MAPAIDVEHSARLEAARSLQSTLENTRLHLIDYREQFDSQQNSSFSDFGTNFNGRKGLIDPAVVGVNVASQVVSRVLLIILLNGPMPLHRYRPSCADSRCNI